MELQKTTAREVSCTLSTGITFDTTFGELSSTILADNIIIGEKLLEENSEQIVPGTEVRRNTTQWSFDDQFVSANAAETMCIPTITDDVPTANRKIIINVPINHIQNLNEQYSAFDCNDSPFNRNIRHAFNSLPGDARRETVRGRERTGKDYLQIEIGQEIFSAQPMQRNPKTNVSFQSENAIRPKSPRKENLKSCQKHQERKRKYMYERHELDNSDKTGMTVENTMSGMEHSAFSLQDSQLQHVPSSSTSTRNDSTADGNELGFTNCHETEILFPCRHNKNFNKKGSESSEAHNILIPDLSNIVQTNLDPQSSVRLKSKKRKIEYSMEDLKVLFASKTKDQLRLKTVKKKIKFLKEMNERWRRKREKVIQEKLSSPKFEERASVRLKGVIKRTECSNELELRPIHFNEDQYLQDCIMAKTIGMSIDSTENEKSKCLDDICYYSWRTEHKVKKVKSLNSPSPPKSSGGKKRISLISVGRRLGCSRRSSSTNQINSQSTLNLQCRYCDILSFTFERGYDGYIANNNKRRENYERSWRNRDKVIRENSLKYPSLAKLMDYKSRSLDCVDRRMECSGKTSNKNEINSQSPSSDSSHHFNVPSVNLSSSSSEMNKNSASLHSLIYPEESRSNCSREKIIVKSTDKSCEENLFVNNRSFDHGIVLENIPINSGENLFDSTEYGASNEKRNRDNLNSETYFRIFPPGTTSISSSHDNPEKEDMYINPENLIKLKGDSQPSGYIENIDEYIDASESLEPDLENLSVLFSEMNLGIDHHYSVFKEININMAEIVRKARTKNYTLFTLVSNSITTAAINITQVFLKTLQSVNFAVMKLTIQLAQNFYNKDSNSEV